MRHRRHSLAEIRASPRNRHQGVRRVLFIELAVNLLVTAAKALFGVFTGSLVIISDAVHSALDAASNVGGLFILNAAERPADKHYPYGRRKLEALAAAIIGLVVGITAVHFAYQATSALVNGRAPEHLTAFGFLVIGVLWAINLAVALWERRKATELASPYLAADAAHTLADVYVTSAVMLSYGAAYYGLSWADAAGTLLVTAVIGRMAWGLLADNLAPLLDAAPIDADELEDLVIEVDGVVACDRVASTGTSQAVRVTAEVVVDARLRVDQADAIRDRVETSIGRAFPSVSEIVVATRAQSVPRAVSGCHETSRPIGRRRSRPTWLTRRLRGAERDSPHR